MSRMGSQRLLSIIAIVLTLATGPIRANEPQPIRVFDPLPLNQRSIEYDSAEGHDPVALLNRRLSSEDIQLEFSDQFGYLPAVLQTLEIPTSSQLLNFESRVPPIDERGNNLIAELSISRTRPRAFYFNQDIFVTWSRQARELEIVSYDSSKGPVFYTLNNQRAHTKPQFMMSKLNGCVACHCHREGITASPSLSVPTIPASLQDGSIMGLSKEARRFGFGSYQTHAIPLDIRWQNSAVTGSAEKLMHRGENIDEAEFRDQYLTGTSDIVAHLIFDHQTTALNLLSRLNYEHQLNVRSKISEMTIRYLLLADEVPLVMPLSGPSAYAAWYQSQANHVANAPSLYARSLYELDLKQRMFRYRISPMIDSRMVRNFPEELKANLFQRLNQILCGTETLKDYSISDHNQQATLAVLRSTIAGWPQGK